MEKAGRQRIDGAGNGAEFAANFYSGGRYAQRYGQRHQNGSFEQPAFDDRPSPQWVPGPTFDWKTTAFHQKIEFGSSRNGHDAPQLTGNNKDIPDGYQFAELNADEESTLYQYATTVGGNVYEWGLSHRGRYDIDQMAVIIGPKQNVDPAKPSKDGKDQFMQMTDWVKIMRCRWA